MLPVLLNVNINAGIVSLIFLKDKSVRDTFALGSPTLIIAGIVMPKIGVIFTEILVESVILSLFT